MLTNVSMQFCDSGCLALADANQRRPPRSMVEILLCSIANASEINLESWMSSNGLALQVEYHGDRHHENGNEA